MGGPVRSHRRGRQEGWWGMGSFLQAIEHKSPIYPFNFRPCRVDVFSTCGIPVMYSTLHLLLHAPRTSSQRSLREAAVQSPAEHVPTAKRLVPKEQLH
jgi:hypothetical protein